MNNSTSSSWIGDYLREPSSVNNALLAAFKWLLTWGPIAVPLIAAALAGQAASRHWWRRHCHATLVAEARCVTVLAPPTVDPAGGTLLWSNLIGLLRPSWKRWLTGQPHLAWEYRFSEHGVTLRLWIPGVIPPGLVERAIESAWPGAHTRSALADLPLPEPAAGRRAVTVGGQLRLARSEALPIRTGFDADPIRGLLGAPVGLGRDEYASVQILARPVTGRRVGRARSAARRVHTGASRRFGGRVLDLLTPGASATRSGRTRDARRVSLDPQLSLEYSAQNRAIVGKQRGSQYETVVRYAVTTHLPADAPDTEARQARDIARGRAHALAASFASYTEHNHYTRTRLRHPAQTLASRRLDRGDLLSVPELAAIAHLPVDTEIPGIERAGAKAVAPPPGIAVPGPEVKPLGVADTGHARPIGLRVPDARHHLHVLGATGSGKSTLLGNLILDDADAGRGIVLIDLWVPKTVSHHATC